MSAAPMVQPVEPVTLRDGTEEAAPLVAVTMLSLREAGYAVEVPETVDALRVAAAVIEKGRG